MKTISYWKIISLECGRGGKMSINIDSKGGIVWICKYQSLFLKLVMIAKHFSLL